MASRDDYTVGWICTRPLDVIAAKAMLDRIHNNPPTDQNVDDNNNYVLGSVSTHNVVLAYPPFTDGVTPAIVAATIDTQMRTNFKSIQFSLVVGVGGGVPNMKEDIRLGDVVVSKPTAARPGLIQCNFEKTDCVDDQLTCKAGLHKLSTILLTATSKAETNNILRESRMAHYISQIVHEEPMAFASPGPERDLLFEEDYGHITTAPAESGCDRCDPHRVQHRPPRDNQNPEVHYGLVASCNQSMCQAATRDKLARRYGVLCFETDAGELKNNAQCLVIRGICDYADSHKSKIWQGYAAAAAAAYAKEILLVIPATPKPALATSDTNGMAATILDALLLTRPEVDRSSLIALKGRRVVGTCEWLIRHPSYQEWLEHPDLPLWISGGPGRGKTMLAIYITEELQQVVDSFSGVLLYYFCSNRDRNRNTAVTIMRGIIHQWLSFRPHLAKYIKNYFEGSETIKYTTSSFLALWRIFLILLQQTSSCRVVCVLDGLDECEKESLRQLLNALEDCFFGSEETRRPNFKLILLSRSQPAILENKLSRSRRIKLDDADIEVAKDVEKYVSAKVTELASQNTLSEEMLAHIRQALMAGADGTFLWVGFVANELKGRSWQKIQIVLRGVPKGLGGIYQRLLHQVEDKEELVPILQWVVLAARPLTIDELTTAADIKASNGQTPAEIMKNKLDSCGLLVKIDGKVVNLVHESAKEFFQSDQVKVQGISMFHMDHTTHRSLLQTCLALLERCYKFPGSIREESLHNTLLAYACKYWPDHFHHAFDPSNSPPELSIQFFRAKSPVREDWWTLYWDQEQYGGAPPSFTLLHLAAFFGNLGWAKVLLEHSSFNHFPFRHMSSQKDNYGRTPLFWAATRGHLAVVKLLLDHGARVNSKDRSKLTALHIAVTGEHKEVVSLLLDRSARIEGRASYGDTPLVRAIQANSEDIIKLLLERGARVDGLPTPAGGGPLKGSTGPLEERAKQLLGLQEQIFASRYENSSRRVEFTIKTLNASFKFPPILQLMTLYLKYSSIGRWEVMHVLQDLVKNNRTTKLRKWAEAYIQFGVQLVEARNAKNLANMTGLSVLIFQVVSTADLEALLVIGVLVGSSVILAAAQHAWREGVDISARTFAQFASLAYHRDAEESLHYGVREFLIDFDACIWSGRRMENVARTVVLFSTHFAIIDTKDQRPIEYFSTVIAEYFEGFIGGSYEEQLFSDATQACVDELEAISMDHDSHRLLLFLTAILQFAERSKDKGQEKFLNMTPMSCLILCQKNPTAHRWLITDAVPGTLSALVSQQPEGAVQNRAFKALVELLVIGKQYELSLPAELRKTLGKNLNSIYSVKELLPRIIDT
ncbi:ankyrin repeat protein [Penicillium macrosclerotiorum]|uniref:ankyrin repeat protein n=1 Tax=Penicillium macrosclerotiorum TaxID=303699 RepID=UPI00254870F4|nr:ankyrin repeat protein [Penicillium macrosclerotiorum]KAJ5692828.1 ankyrin repeat protein [Penicillium macrosclerotiorum]